MATGSRLGLIARCDNSGLANQTHEFWRHMQPEKTLVIDVGYLHDNTKHCNKRSYPDRYPGAMVHKGWSPPSDILTTFLDGLDLVFTAETPYSRELIPLARQRGIKVVIQPNWEFFDFTLQPDLWAAPSLWHYDEMPHPKVHLPVPIASDRFRKRRAHRNSGSRRHFLHIVGRPAERDRNGTPNLLAALRHTKSAIKLTLKCQDANYLQRLLAAHEIPGNVEIVADSGDTENYWDLYSDGEVMILPRRFGGLCLPVNEALGAGMPVIVPDIEPNNTWLPSEWLVAADKTDSFRAHQHVDVFTTDPLALAGKMDQFACPDFLHRARRKAEDLAAGLSWETMRPEYERALAGDMVPQ